MFRAEQKQKFKINFRPLAVAFLSLLLGIICARRLYSLFTFKTPVHHSTSINSPSTIMWFVWSPLGVAFSIVLMPRTPITSTCPATESHSLLWWQVCPPSRYRLRRTMQRYLFSLSSLTLLSFH